MADIEEKFYPHNIAWIILNRLKEFEKKLDHETTIYVDNNSSDIEQTAKTAYKKIKKFEKNLNKIKK